jgi:hypothetical protein
MTKSPDPDTVRLLFGPYTAPPLKKGDRAHCHLRDATVVITSWSGWRVPWPSYRTLGGNGSGSGLLVSDKLLRALRTEAAVAVSFWWGVPKSAASG